MFLRSADISSRIRGILSQNMFSPDPDQVVCPPQPNRPISTALSQHEILNLTLKS